MGRRSIFVLVCPCGRQIELPDAERLTQCRCGRTLVVEVARKDQVKSVQGGLHVGRSS